MQGFEDMSEEEKEDYQIKDSDALIIAAKIVRGGDGTIVIGE